MAEATHVRASRINVAVIGAGTMGAQIAALSAYSGHTVALHDAAPGALDHGLRRIESEILPNIDASSTSQGSLNGAFHSIRIANSLAEAVQAADLVIEAVKEEIGVKREVFAELSRLAPDAVLATNSSSLPSSLIADVVANPQRLLNMHFFAPIWVRPMLELMTCGVTNDPTFQLARRFGQSLGLTVATAQIESKGFIINRIWRAVKRESLRVVDEGVADPEDIDRLWMLFFQTRYAPFGVMDMVGLDVVRDIESAYQADTLDPTDTPSPALLRKIVEGKLGEKSGEGFYMHPNPAYLQTDFLKPTIEDS